MIAGAQPFHCVYRTPAGVLADRMTRIGDTVPEPAEFWREHLELQR